MVNHCEFVCSKSLLPVTVLGSLSLGIICRLRMGPDDMYSPMKDERGQILGLILPQPSDITARLVIELEGLCLQSRR